MNSILDEKHSFAAFNIVRMAKPALLKGTRDFLPHQIVKREYLFGVIKSVYRKFGFLPIETPAMERSETLMGKYGEEGDRLIFKILNNGDFMAGVDSTEPSGRLASQISKRALRYDLTVPFARFVSQHRNEISFPFKRYQIQPVWRADRPQKGRYQEFFQCDGDVVGSDSLLHEVEFIQVFDEVLSELALDQFTIRINNRKILTGMAEVSNCSDKFSDMAVALDKLDKIGMERVQEEWSKRGLSQSSIASLSELFEIPAEQALAELKHRLASSEVGMKGVKELEFIVDTTRALGLSKASLLLDFTLARGLDYYTGAIFEVTTDDYAIGSICGGGRYDDLTGVFDFPGVSGVGISFGADRIYDVLEATSKWPEDLHVGSLLMFVNFGEQESQYCMNLLKVIRNAGVAAELYPTSAKMKKQMKYADDKGIPYVALVGSQEMETGVISVKNMKTGEQEKVKSAGLVSFLSER